jgi:hypothetical protein
MENIMNKYAAYILALTLPLTMMACSKSGSSAGNDPTNNIDEAAKDPDLQTKIFRGDCSLKPLGSHCLWHCHSRWRRD